MEAVERCAARRQGVEVRRADVGAEGTQVTEACVVEDDCDHIGRTLRRLGLAGKRGVDSAAVKPICWGWSMSQRVDRRALAASDAGLACSPMQGHVPVPPQPHFPEGLGPFLGYVATREPRPLDERAPEEAAWADADGTVLDQFADVGDWEPIHRPLVQVMAVIVSIALVVAGVGTVLEIVLSAR